MSVTSINIPEAENVMGQAAQLRDKIKREGEGLLAEFRKMVGTGMQGVAADAADQLATDVNTSTLAAGDAVTKLNNAIETHKGNMTTQDQKTNSEISGG